MDVDPMESIEDGLKGRLNAIVAITVALLATFIGICQVKDSNIVQAMQQAQADKIDHWGWYQARNIREEIARSTLTELEVQAASSTSVQEPLLAKDIAAYQALADSQGAKKDRLQKDAENDQVTYDALNYRDDQFDLSDALLALAISLLAMTALTRKRWLLLVAMAPTALGLLMGLAGILGWKIHPSMIASLLS